MASSGRTPPRGCNTSAQACVSRTRVQVLKPLLAERIDFVARQSPSFRAAWDMIRRSGLPVRIGTDDQLRSRLPHWYRQHPNEWAGVTVTETGGRDELSGAVVALRLGAMEKTARRTPRGSEYLLAELDRVLIHEIYGHLAPMVAARDVQHECLDQLRPGEATPCVQVRERRIAAELSNYRLAHAAGSAAER
ncbi:MAG TPA: hypothetical protein VF021_05220 [Longimicrobiales bacterium]